ncbi:MAG: acyl-CoA dehydrogenase family protein [Coriobacteriia bacterium]|nr:acyl-CoA dehydrogenase family protein [Coriobacteriia bacterium]MCL2749638.1 acyl-CoA dehydrogenase family protein [Coriobacteriia bacterium]
MDLLDYNLTKEQQLIQKSFREFSEKVIEPKLDIIENECHIPAEIFEGLAEMGAFGMPIPEEYGGCDAGWDGYTLMMEQVARVAPGVAIMISAHTGLLQMLMKFGSEEQKEKWIPAGARGEVILNGGFTEPQTGSDPKQILATAKPDGDFLILNGTKRFITSAGMGPSFFFARRTDTNEIGAFIIPQGSEGYSMSEQWKKIGQHGGVLVDVYLKDVKIPKENQIASERGFEILTKGIGFGKLGVVTVSLGSAVAAYDEAYKYVTQKMHRDQPITKFQAVQMRLADVYTKLETARAMTYRFAGMCNRAAAGEVGDAELAKQGAMTKLFVTNQVFECARSAQMVHGAYGTVTDYPITRILRDASMGSTLEGQEDMQKVIIASYLLGKR